MISYIYIYLTNRIYVNYRRTIEIDQLYYPERLQYFFMVNAPWFFTAIFAIIKPWLDKVTADKFKILGSDYLPTLEKYFFALYFSVLFSKTCVES